MEVKWTNSKKDKPLPGEWVLGRFSPWRFFVCGYNYRTKAWTFRNGTRIAPPTHWVSMKSFPKPLSR